MNKPLQNKRIDIAIDCGATTGIAIWDGECLSLNSGTFWEMVNYLKKMIDNYYIPNDLEFRILIENPNLVQITFRRKDGKDNTMAEKAKLGANDRMARNVGMVMRDAQLWLDWCKFHNYKHYQVKPLKKIWGDSGKDKINHKQFVLQTKYHGQTNQHERDAGLILVAYSNMNTNIKRRVAIKKKN